LFQSFVCPFADTSCFVDSLLLILHFIAVISIELESTEDSSHNDR